MEKTKLEVVTMKQNPILILQVLKFLQSFCILLMMLPIVDFYTLFVNDRLFSFFHLSKHN